MPTELDEGTPASEVLLAALIIQVVRWAAASIFPGGTDLVVSLRPDSSCRPEREYDLVRF